MSCTFESTQRLTRENVPTSFSCVWDDYEWTLESEHSIGYIVRRLCIGRNYWQWRVNSRFPIPLEISDGWSSHIKRSVVYRTFIRGLQSKARGSKCPIASPLSVSTNASDITNLVTWLREIITCCKAKWINSLCENVHRKNQSKRKTKEESEQHLVMWVI